MTSSSGFDPAAYKATTHKQWDSAAEAWHRWGPTLEEWLGDATEMMLDLAAVGIGSRVLDVAAGAGGQTIAAAQRVGSTGSVLATDISLEILHYAQSSAREVGLDNVEIFQADGETLSFPPDFDAAISRVGLIYFPDQVKALLGIRSSLRPGGKFATVTYSTADMNEFFSVPIGIVRRRANLPPPLPGQPGPFSLGQDGTLADVLKRAGYSNIEVRKVSAPVRMATAADYLRFARESFGALHQMLASLSEEERADTWQEIEDAMEVYEGPAGFVGPCELLVGAGTNP
ncbi:MAG: class I SAM-dependent methyltransferase [Armatimonadetes bacterium]|nr:class I SAM-dependent methyltransferase [Armatimonadota bacterium]